jgi:hypothetical protein
MKGGGRGAAYSADGKRLASGGKAWNAESGEELLSLHLEARYGIAFGPDSHFLASAEWQSVTIFDATRLPEKACRPPSKADPSAINSPSFPSACRGAAA